MRTRSGVSGGLDILFDEVPEIYINVPVNEYFASLSPYSIETDGDRFYLRSPEACSGISVLPEPSYYQESTVDGGESLSRIAQMCSADRLCYGMTGPGCSFWARDQRCKYCSIGNNYSADASRKSESHFVEVLDRAVNDPVRRAHHVLIGGGTPPGEDMGARAAARVTKLLKSRYNMSVYVMIAAPLERRYIDELYDVGVDELGINIEFWGEEAWASFIPGKLNRIGKSLYLRMLEYAAALFGPERARSIVIAGLEPARETINAVEYLTSIGVMPIISPFRPLNGTLLADRRGFDGSAYWDIYEQAQGSLRRPA